MDEPDTPPPRGPQVPEQQEGLDRRTFLKGAAVAGATVAAAAGAIVATAREAAPKSGAKSRETGAVKGKSGDRVPGDITIPRPGSDFMVDVIKTLDIDYVAANPASGFRSLHESLVNYGGNRKPELITCTHEETSVGIAHGYAKAAGKPMMAMVHGTVGLQHASMAIYNAWCDRVPVLIVAGNRMDAIVRDFVKWDDTPASLQHFSESMVRAYRIATTAPMEPVLINADIDLQEDAIHEENLRIPRLTRRIQAAGDYAALEEAAKLLAAAQNPVIIADRAVRSQAGVERIVQLAETLGAPVVSWLSTIRPGPKAAEIPLLGVGAK